MMYIETNNPSTGELLKQYKLLDRDNLNKKISDANSAFEEWKTVPIADRCTLLKRVGEILRNSQGELAALMTDEMGKVDREARAEIEKCASVCDYYAENATTFLADEYIETNASKSYVRFEPLGVLLAVMPWNFPFWQVFRFAAPAIAAGNACLLKHATNVSGCAIAIDEIFRQANMPPNLFTSLIIDSRQVEHVLGDPLVKAVTVTGSAKAGRSVAAFAGENLKKVVIELGGSDPYIVLSDADLDVAVSACVTSRLINAGQSCISAKRFIVNKQVYRQFEELFVAEMAAKKFGNPKEDSSDFGPLAKAELRDDLHQQVCKSIDRGAKLLCGGELPKANGNFYPATVLSHVPSDCPAYNEELFGPVASIISAEDDDDAIRIANDTSFGLGAALFSKNVDRALSLVPRIQSGSVVINSFLKSDPRLPFGGTKESGFGRELSHYGIKEFVNIKTIIIE